MTRSPDTRAHGGSPLTWRGHTAVKPLNHERKTLWNPQESSRLESEVTEKGPDPDQFTDPPLANIIQNLRNYLTKTSTPRSVDDSIIRKGFNATHDALALLASAVTELQGDDLGNSTNHEGQESTNQNMTSVSTWSKHGSKTLGA